MRTTASRCSPARCSPARCSPARCSPARCSPARCRRFSASISSGDTSDRFATISAKHYPVHPGSTAGITTPIVTASTFRIDNAEHAARLSEKPEAAVTDADGFFYSRWGSPTNQCAASAVSALEDAAGTFVFASGMNAISTAMLSVVKSGDHVVCPKALYGGTFEWLSIWGDRLGIAATLVDSTDPDAYRAAIRPNTTLLYAESPCNPTMRLTDLQALGELKLALGPEVTTMVDSTFATPYLCRPLRIPGIDVVVHAATKYMGGHSDLTAGTVSANCPQRLAMVGKASKLFGGMLPAFDSYLLQRGLKTLDVRMERHCANAMQVAAHLERHPAVERVYYPGLLSHPDHTLAASLFHDGAGFGGMLSFEVKGKGSGGGSHSGSEVSPEGDAGRRLVENVKLITLAVSLGGVESLIEHPASMTHCMISREEREAGGITDGLVRLSVGLEDYRDIIGDLDQALSAL